MEWVLAMVVVTVVIKFVVVVASDMADILVVAGGGNVMSCPSVPRGTRYVARDKR